MGPLTIEQVYLQNMKELKVRKDDFAKWKLVLDASGMLSVEDSLKLLKEFNITIPRILIPNFTYPLKLYRVRVIPSGSEEDLNKVSTFSYPPAEFAKTYQRANVPGHPVFYGAFDGKTAFEEIRYNGNEKIKKGDKVFFSEWRVKAESRYSLAHLTLPTLTGEQHMLSALNQRIYSEMHRIFSSEEEFFAKTQKFLFQSMSELFLFGSYLQSGIIAHQIIYDTPEVRGIKINGVIYPSCSNNFRSANVALHPEFVDEHLQLESIRQVSFEEFSEDGVRFTGSYFGSIEGPIIKWQSYYSKLLTDNFKIEIELDEDTIFEDMMNAIVVHDQEGEHALGEYCQMKADEIDLTDYKIPQKLELSYAKGEELLCIQELPFLDGEMQIKNGGKLINVSLIRLYVPLETKPHGISAQDLLKTI
jgi:hypothetical protein